MMVDGSVKFDYNTYVPKLLRLTILDKIAFWWYVLLCFRSSCPMFSAACLNLPVGMRMHNIGRSVKSYTSLQASANLCRSSRGKAASARLLSSSSSTNLRRALSAASLDASKNLRGFATGTRFLGQSQAASVTDDASFSNATTDSQHDAAAAAAAAAAGAAGRTVREDWMVSYDMSCISTSF